MAPAEPLAGFCSRPDPSQAKICCRNTLEWERFLAGGHGEARGLALGCGLIGGVVPSLQTGPRDLSRRSRSAQLETVGSDDGSGSYRRPESGTRLRAAH